MEAKRRAAAAEAEERKAREDAAYRAEHPERDWDKLHQYDDKCADLFFALRNDTSYDEKRRFLNLDLAGVSSCHRGSLYPDCLS